MRRKDKFRPFRRQFNNRISNTEPEVSSPNGVDLEPMKFGPDILTVHRYGRGMTHDQRYRPASSQSVSDFGTPDSVLGSDSFLGL
tara:strand:+ start:216 stop:470 length:255 start_codon:yes stop_codon:yes gene_type:complete